MVPIGDKAFMKGTLTHTNEVTIAIGDNYFIKCSVQHARSVITRRLELIETNIKQFKEEFDFIKKQLGMAAEILEVNEKETNDMIEIREEYNSEDELDHIEVTPTPPKQPKIEVLASTDIPEKEEDPFQKVLDHFVELEEDENTKNLLIEMNLQEEEEEVVEKLEPKNITKMEEIKEEQRKKIREESSFILPITERNISSIQENHPLPSQNYTSVEGKKISLFRRQLNQNK